MRLLVALVSQPLFLLLPKLNASTLECNSNEGNFLDYALSRSAFTENVDSRLNVISTGGGTDGVCLLSRQKLSTAEPVENPVNVRYAGIECQTSVEIFKLGPGGILN